MPLRFRWNGQEFDSPAKMTFAEIAAAEGYLGVDMDEWRSGQRTLAMLYAGARRHALATGAKTLPTWEQVAESSPEDDSFDVIRIEDPAPAGDARPPVEAPPSSPPDTPPAEAGPSPSGGAPTSSS